MFSHPADMTPKQWNIVLQTNSLLHGSYARVTKGKTIKVERAMYPGTSTFQPLFPAYCALTNKLCPAFVLKPRVFYDYEVSMKTDIIAPKVRLGTKNPPMLGTCCCGN